MRLDFTQQELFVIRQCIRIAIEDGSIYSGDNDAQIRQTIDSTMAKMNEAKRRSGDCYPPS